MRVLTGKVETREGHKALVSLDDGSTRRLEVPEAVEVVPGTSVRIIEPGEPDRPTFVGWGRTSESPSASDNTVTFAPL